MILLFTQPKTTTGFFAAPLHCCLGFNFWSITILKYILQELLSSQVFLILYLGIWILFPKWRNVHLALLNFTLLLRDHFFNLSRRSLDWRSMPNVNQLRIKQWIMFLFCVCSYCYESRTFWLVGQDKTYRNKYSSIQKSTLHKRAFVMNGKIQALNPWLKENVFYEKGPHIACCPLFLYPQYISNCQKP